MIIQLIISGFMLGTVSSFHCVGMCGPLALSLPVQHLPAWQKTVSLFLYHGGRITVYGVLGLIAGVAGRGLYLAGFQQWFSIGLGVLMIFFLIQYSIYKKFPQPAIVRKGNMKIQQLISRFWNSPARSGFILLGMANGLLPCGMVYLAIAGALNQHEIKYSVVFMLVFGLGTLPPLFALSFFGSLIRLSFRNRIKQVTPFIVAGMAIFLILRGLNLGIPYISPLSAPSGSAVITCH